MRVTTTVSSEDEDYRNGAYPFTVRQKNEKRMEIRSEMEREEENHRDYFDGGNPCDKTHREKNDVGGERVESNPTCGRLDEEKYSMEGCNCDGLEESLASMLDVSKTAVVFCFVGVAASGWKRGSVRLVARLLEANDSLNARKRLRWFPLAETIIESFCNCESSKQKIRYVLPVVEKTTMRLRLEFYGKEKEDTMIWREQLVATCEFSYSSLLESGGGPIVVRMKPENVTGAFSIKKGSVSMNLESRDRQISLRVLQSIICDGPFSPLPYKIFPFFVLWRLDDRGLYWQPLYRSELALIKNGRESGTIEAKYATVELDDASFANGDDTRLLRLEFYAFFGSPEDSSGPLSIGYCTTNFGALRETPAGTKLALEGVGWKTSLDNDEEVYGDVGVEVSDQLNFLSFFAIRANFYLFDSPRDVTIDTNICLSKKLWPFKTIRLFYVIYQLLDSGNAKKAVYRSEVGKVGLTGDVVRFKSPNFRRLALNRGDENAEIRLEVFHFKVTNSHPFIGFVRLRLPDLESGVNLELPFEGARLTTGNKILGDALVTSRREGRESTHIALRIEIAATI